MEIENKEEKQAEQRVRCLYAQMHISHSKFYKLYPKNQSSRNILDTAVTSFSHKRKKANEKLVQMKFLKDNKTIILGYDKASERGDINFIDAAEPKISDFYYNKLQGGLGGISCFEDGRFILAADKKGVFTYIDLSKGPNIQDIKNNSIQTAIEGVLDICLAPTQSKAVCGTSDNKCLIVDIGKQKSRVAPSVLKKFQRHVYGVNSVNWHPYKSLILSSSVDINDTIKLWDPQSQQLIHDANFHGNSTVTKCLFHPEGNTYLSLGKDNQVLEYEIRFKGILNRIKLESQATAIEVMRNGNLVIGDSNGNLNWYDRSTELLMSIAGTSGVVMMSSDWSKTILAVGREREHTFELFTHQNAMNIQTA